MKLFNRFYILLFALGILVFACKEDQSAASFQDVAYYKVKAAAYYVNFDAHGTVTDDGQDIVELTIHPNGEAVTITSSESWCQGTLITVDSKSYLKISTDPNLGETRTCTIEAMVGKGADKQGAIIRITQETSLLVNPVSILSSSELSEYDLTVKSVGTWTVSGEQDWCTLSHTSGEGNSTIQVAIAENILLEARNASLIFTSGDLSVTVSVSQMAALPIDDSFEFVLVNAGTFAMGATPEQTGAAANEKEPHQVTLTKNYYLGKYPVTQKQWALVMGNSPSMFSGDNKPVETVSYTDVQEFITKLNARTGKNYRLPTEAEWEYAARGGNQSKGYLYSGGNTIATVAWYDSNSTVNGLKSTQDVGTKVANELGIHDMSGNVYEWVSDWYEASFSADAVIDPTGPATGTKHVLKGGSYRNGASNLRVAKRASEAETTKSDNLGFRLARSID